MNGCELRRIQKAAAVQTVSGDEVSPFFATVCQVEADTAGAEAAVGRCDAAVGLSTPSPDFVVTLITKLVLSPNSAGGAPEMTSSD